MQENQLKKPFLISIPHSGERIPEEASWLTALPERLLMCDVDRYVDRLYDPVLQKLRIPSVRTEWHRYAIDLNRLSEDVDADSVLGHENPPGAHPRGLHWSITTQGEKLMPGPIPRDLHKLLVQKYFEPFHTHMRETIDTLKAGGARVVYHIDAHSMPSVGTQEHRDPGEKRADIVISDCEGRSCSADFRDRVIAAYERAGFKVAYNWPYKGGRVTETYGHPNRGQESIQVELNRSLYMDERSKSIMPAASEGVQKQITQAVEEVYASLPDL